MFTPIEFEVPDSIIYTTNQGTIREIRPRYTQYIVDLLTKRSELYTILGDLQQKTGKLTLENAFYIGCEAIGHIDTILDHLDKDTNNLYACVTTMLKAYASREDVVKEYLDPNYLFYANELVIFTQEVQKHLEMLGMYFSELNHLMALDNPKIANFMIEEKLDEISNLLEELESLRWPIQKYTFSSKISQYHFDCIPLIKSKHPVSADKRDVILYNTHCIWEKLYMETHRPDYISLFLITASSILKKIIEDKTFDKDKKVPFTNLYIQIDSAIQAAKTVHKDFYLGATPQFFYQMQEIEFTQVVSEGGKNKIISEFERLITQIDLKNNRPIYNYVFSQTILVHNLKIEKLFTVHSYNWADQDQQKNFFQTVDDLVQIFNTSKQVLMEKDDFGINGINQPLLFNSGKFLLHGLNTIELLFSICEIIMSINYHKNVSIHRPKGRQEKKKEQIENAYTEAKALLQQVTDRIIAISKDVHIILKEALVEFPLSLEMMPYPSLKLIKQLIRMTAEEQGITTYKIEKDLLETPLPKQIVDKVVLHLEVAINARKLEFFNRLISQRDENLQKLNPRNRPTNNITLTTQDIVQPEKKIEPYTEEELSNIPINKKKRKKRKKPVENTSSSTSCSSTTQILDKEKEDTFSKKIDIKSLEEKLLDEALRLYSINLKDESSETLDKCIAFAKERDNNIILIQALHAKVSHLIIKITGIKGHILTYEKLLDPAIKYDQQKINKGMRAWQDMILSTKKLKENKNLLIDAFSKEVALYSFDKDVIQTIRNDIENFEHITQEFSTYLSTELQKQEDGQAQFYEKHKYKFQEAKDPGIFYALKSQVRRAIGAIRGVHAMMSAVRCTIDKNNYPLGKAPKTLAQIQEPILEKPNNDLTQIKVFLKNTFERGPLIDRFITITALYNAALNEKNPIVSNKICLKKLQDGKICDGNGILPKYVAEYIRSKLKKEKEDPIVFSYEGMTISSR